MINSRVRAAAAGRGHAVRVLEHIGVVVLAAALVIGIALAGWGDEVRALTTQTVCSITPQPDCPSGPAATP
jgi:hypothetical protein